MDDVNGEENVDQELEKLSSYRSSLISQILADEKEYHTTITYIAAGALALFLTINESFFSVSTGSYPFAFIASLIFLFITLALYIVNIVSDIRAHESLRDAADEMLAKKEYDKPSLLNKWNGLIGQSRWLTYTRMVTLFIGIFLEVLFIAANLFSEEENKLDQKSKIEIILPSKNAAKINYDSASNSLEIRLSN